jgi:hypothetical protein
MKWDKHVKPPAHICPKDLCFHWHESENGCSAAVQELLGGKCRRDSGNPNDPDIYEPCEPYLEGQGLPWFYFIPNVEGLVFEDWEEYLRESQKLWGEFETSDTINMYRLNPDSEKYIENENYAYSNEAFFAKIKGLRPFLERQDAYIREIGAVTDIDYQRLAIKTKSGAATADDFSPDLKTLLNALYFVEETPAAASLLYLGECSEAAVNLILAKTGGRNLSYFVDRIVKLDRALFDEYMVNLNGIRIMSAFEFKAHMTKCLMRWDDE